jgi:hypothetical protein
MCRVIIDGSWQKRGFFSRKEIFIDFSAFSKHCKGCQRCEGNKGTAEFEEWKSKHNCQINHRESSGASGAVEIFRL